MGIIKITEHDKNPFRKPGIGFIMETKGIKLASPIINSYKIFPSENLSGYLILANWLTLAIEIINRG